MVLYGIWLIDGNSGLLLAHVTVPGFDFGADLFSGFIAAAHDFAQETSGAKLRTMILGNFKLLVRRDRILMKVLAVGALDPEARYDQFFDDIESRADPILAKVHRDPSGFKAVTPQLRRQLLEVITSELDRFSTRKAPGDLWELPILQEEDAQKLIKNLVQRQNTELIPEPALTETGYTYPLATSISGLSDEDTNRLLEDLAEYGLLLSEAVESSLCCPNCKSTHLHPHIFCPSCQTVAEPVNLYEHITCGHVSRRVGEPSELECENCEAKNENGHDFRLFRGYQCSQCKSSFTQPLMIFVCHNCRNNIYPEGADVKILQKYMLNPALVAEFELLFSEKVEKPKKDIATEEKFSPSITEPLKAKIGDSSVEEELTPHQSEEAQSEPEMVETNSRSPQSLLSETQSVNEQPEQEIRSDGAISEEEAEFNRQLEELEVALKKNKITEAEYDRRFIHIRLKLRQLRAQSAG